MAKPSAKRVVLSHYPTARAERHKPTHEAAYYLVRRTGEYMYDGEGDTEARAWANAMARLNLTGIRKGGDK